MRGEKGFSLLEMLISLMLLGLALALSTSLWMESARILVETGRRARDPILSLASQRVRMDVQEASAWTPLGGALLLERASGQVIYVPEDGLLMREIRDLNGSLLNRRPVLDHVTRFAAREIAPGILEVVMAAELRERAHVQVLAGRVNTAPPGRERSVRLVLAMRATPGGRSW